MVLSRPGSVIKKRPGHAQGPGLGPGYAQGPGLARESLDGLSRLHVSFLEEREEEGGGGFLDGGSLGGGGGSRGGGGGGGGVREKENKNDIFPPTYVNELVSGPGGRLSALDESSLWVNPPSNGMRSLGNNNHFHAGGAAAAGGGGGGGGGDGRSSSSYAAVTQRAGLLRMDTHPLIVTDTIGDPPV